MMKTIATLLTLSLLVSSTWAEIPQSVKPMPTEVQVPFSFIPPNNSIYSGTTLKPIQELSEVQVMGDSLVSVPTTPFRPTGPSLIDGINPKQAKGLSTEIAQFMANQQKAESTTILMRRPESRKLQAFDTLLETALRAQGFAVSRMILPGVVPLSYQVIRIRQEILVRLVVNQLEATRLYRDDLIPLTPFTLLKEGGQP